jgi:RHS repeat-associated protein
MGFYFDSSLAPTGRTRKPATPRSAGVGPGRRFCNPSLGCWLSKDPIGEWGGENLHAHFADCVNEVDVLGLLGPNNVG